MEDIVEIYFTQEDLDMLDMEPSLTPEEEKLFAPPVRKAEATQSMPILEPERVAPPPTKQHKLRSPNKAGPTASEMFVRKRTQPRRPPTIFKSKTIGEKTSIPSRDMRRNSPRPGPAPKSAKEVRNPPIFPVTRPMRAMITKPPEQNNAPRSLAQKEYTMTTAEGVCFQISFEEMQGIPYDRTKASQRRRYTVFLKNNRKVNIKMRNSKFIWTQYKDSAK